MKNLLSAFLAPDTRAAKIITSLLLAIPLVIELIDLVTKGEILSPDQTKTALLIAAGLKLISNFTSKKKSTPPVREKPKGSGRARKFSNLKN